MIHENTCYNVNYLKMLHIINFDKMQYVDHNVNLTLVSVYIYFNKKKKLYVCTVIIEKIK